MQISNEKVATLNYLLADSDGKTIDAVNDASFVYLHGANNIIPGLENALEGKSKGDKVSVVIEPEDAYGERDDARIEQVPKSMFESTEEALEVGMQFHAQGPDGQALLVTIVAVEDDSVVIDGNHPLAGVQLHFDVEVVDVRDASEEELSHGHVHGPHGHNH